VSNSQYDLPLLDFLEVTSASPSANAVGKENWQPPSNEITISARRA
jgi:hypothetical protein